MSRQATTARSLLIMRAAARQEIQPTRCNIEPVESGEAADQVGPELGPQITADFPEVLAALARRAGG